MFSILYLTPQWSFYLGSFKLQDKHLKYYAYLSALMVKGNCFRYWVFGKMYKLICYKKLYINVLFINMICICMYPFPLTFDNIVLL